MNIAYVNKFFKIISLENLIKKVILLCSIIYFSAIHSLTAQIGDDYKSLFQNNEYQKSYEIIISKINLIYSTRVQDRRIPAGYIAMSNAGEDDNLLKLFKKRKEKGFFIEDNAELAELHLYAGRCSAKLEKKKEGLNHFIQSLRFRKLEPGRDDIIYYEIAQIFKKYSDQIYYKGYIESLEQAYTLNPKNYQYSYELGYALSVTNDKKNAIFHFKRYLENSEDTPKPETFRTLGNLYESIGKYYETEKYYNEYLKLKPDDAETLFALGYISYFRTGNYPLAESSLERVIKILKDGDIYRKSKSYEYLGDMSYNNLKFNTALSFYYECIKYQEKTIELIKSKDNEKKTIDSKINILKGALINNKEFEKYEDYEILVDERNKIDKELENLELEFNKLQPGRVRWFIAVSNEKIKKYDEAIKYYRESIKFDYNSNDAREMIVKLQLKIKRGY